MLYLYLGYVVTQFYSIVGVFSKTTVAPSALFFSLVVFVIWSFIPLMGYLLAKKIGAKGHATKVTLLIAGIVIALIENSLTFFNLINEQHYNIGTALVFFLCFIVAYLPLSKKQND